ncbi:MerR family transcriptional regulator [Paenibacillus sanguinis]|uniref:MerR family transcriptional regulator n=1 Tax=Paenibacillus sanguinis TaxID=225906 RepID=UPI000375F096|nr:MerR family transcriptional regulator [Paenibacillus sanguinis]
MNYCIGEFSSLLGISRDTLRLYEKHDIVKPMKDEHNNYRYFSDLDARDMLMSRWYRSLQIPLQDVAQLIKESPMEKILASVEQSRNQLAEDIRRSTMLLGKLDELAKEIQDIEGSLWQCKLKARPGLYRIQQTDKNNLLDTKGIEEVINTLMEWLPYTFYCFCIERETFISESFSLDYGWGLTISEEDVKLLNIELEKRMLEYIPPSACLSAVILSPSQEHFTKDILQFMIDALEEQELTVAGDVTGRLMFTEKRDGVKRSYLEILIPVNQVSDDLG